jgi:hypothetical protein
MMEIGLVFTLPNHVINMTWQKRTSSPRHPLLPLADHTLDEKGPLVVVLGHSWRESGHQVSFAGVSFELRMFYHKNK